MRYGSVIGKGVATGTSLVWVARFRCAVSETGYVRAVSRACVRAFGCAVLRACFLAYVRAVYFVRAGVYQGSARRY